MDHMKLWTFYANLDVMLRWKILYENLGMIQYESKHVAV